jgi:DNA-binding SARP family transcriptional activator
VELGDFSFARECAESILTRNPYSEAAYRIIIEVELAIGTESAALGAYRRAVAARREIGLELDEATAALLQGQLH